MRYVSSDVSNTIVFEKIEGLSLAQLIEEPEAATGIDWGVLVGKLIPIIETLARLGMLHRDLTPQNFMVRVGEDSKDPDLLLIDFAFAGLLASGINDAFIDEGELAFLGLAFKPKAFHWDDAYSALRIVEYIEEAVNVDAERVKSLLAERVGLLSYTHEEAAKDRAVRR